MKKTELIILLIILGSSALLGASLLTRGQAWGDDYAAYIMQAQSLLRGSEKDFIERNAFTIFQSSSMVGPVAYPWGYPLILSSVYAVSGFNLVALKLPDLFFYIAFLFCLFLIYRRRMPAAQGLLLMAVLAFHPDFLSFIDQILSDIPYLFFSIFALLILDAYVVRSNHYGKYTVEILLIGVVIFLATFIRTPGLILLITVLIFQARSVWIHRQDRSYVKYLLLNTLAICLAFGILWVLSLLLIPNGQASYESYLAPFTSTIFETIKNNSFYYFWLFGQFFDRLIFGNLIYFALLIFFVIGAWVNRKRDLVFLAYFVVSILLLLVWPAVQGIRFIFPLLPLFVYFSFQGMKSAALKVGVNHNKIAAGAVYGFWSVSVLVFLWATLSQVQTNFQNERNLSGPFDRYSVQVYQYIAANTRPDSVVIFFKPRAMSLMTDRSTLKVDNCKQLKAGDFDVVDKDLGAVGQVPFQALPQCQVKMVKVFENPVFIIYRILNKKQVSLVPSS